MLHCAMLYMHHHAALIPSTNFLDYNNSQGNVFYIVEPLGNFFLHHSFSLNLTALFQDSSMQQQNQ
ncbi:hypothetical protein X975_18930, partial [Stegodyphus mimosarum]